MSTVTVGVDIGSRTIKLVTVADGENRASRVVDTSFDPLAVCRGEMAQLEYDRLVVTGYGRHLFKEHWPEAEVITEIKAVALGARAIAPGCHRILDIGGQDSKVVALDDRGGVRKFAMNDKCAAGTGRFLEVIAAALSYTRDEFIDAALEARDAVTLNSMCAVFAESEVVSLVARGVERPGIARGIHRAVATRASALLKQLPGEGTLLFSGGGALNRCLASLLSEIVPGDLIVPESPQTITAMGCAIAP